MLFTRNLAFTQLQVSFSDYRDLQVRRNGNGRAFCRAKGLNLLASYSTFALALGPEAGSAVFRQPTRPLLSLSPLSIHRLSPPPLSSPFTFSPVQAIAPPADTTGNLFASSSSSSSSSSPSPCRVTHRRQCPAHQWSLHPVFLLISLCSPLSSLSLKAETLDPRQ